MEEAQERDGLDMMLYHSLELWDSQIKPLYLVFLQLFRLLDPTSLNTQIVSEACTISFSP